MAVKSFIRGDFRTLVIDNDYPTNYKVYYNGRWNYIQDEESFIKRLDPSLGESYLNRFNLKVLDNNQWVKLAILDNYYNKNEKRNSIFYRTITKENFNFKPRAVNFTELDARLGLNNLQDLFISNEDKSINNQIEENINENLNKDQICYFVGYDVSYDELSSVKYNSNEIDNFSYNEIAFNDNNIELDKYNEKISIDKKLLNNTNSFTISENLVINEEGTTFTSFLSNDHYVKSVLINNFGNSSDNGGIFRFYDQDGNLIESGELITNTISYAETENFIITCNGTSWNSDSGWYCSGAFRTDINKKCLADTNLYYGYDSGVVGGWVKCEFKTPVKISRIESNIFGSNLTVRASWNSDTATVNVQFEDEVVEDFIYTVKRFNSNYIDSHNISEAAHPINTIEYIETSNNCRYDMLEKYNKYSISGKRILDSDCDLHFAMSFDNRNTYYVYKDENWSIIDKDKEIINSNGMTLEELESINNNLILAEFPSNTNFDLFVTIVNKNSKYGEAPLLKSLDSYFLEKGKFDTFLVEEVNVYDFIFGSWGGCYIRFYDENSDLINDENSDSDKAEQDDLVNALLDELIDVPYEDVELNPDRYVHTDAGWRKRLDASANVYVTTEIQSFVINDTIDVGNGEDLYNRIKIGVIVSDDVEYYGNNMIGSVNIHKDDTYTDYGLYGVSDSSTNTPYGSNGLSKLASNSKYLSRGIIHWIDCALSNSTTTYVPRLAVKTESDIRAYIMIKGIDDSEILRKCITIPHEYTNIENNIAEYVFRISNGPNGLSIDFDTELSSILSCL